MNPRIYVAVVGLFVLAAPSVPVGQSVRRTAGGRLDNLLYKHA